MPRLNKRTGLILLGIAIFLTGLFTSYLVIGTILAIVVGFLALAQKE